MHPRQSIYYKITLNPRRNIGWSAQNDFQEYLSYREQIAFMDYAAETHAQDTSLRLSHNYTSHLITLELFCIHWVWSSVKYWESRGKMSRRVTQNQVEAGRNPLSLWAPVPQPDSIQQHSWPQTPTEHLSNGCFGLPWARWGRKTSFRSLCYIQV